MAVGDVFKLAFLHDVPEADGDVIITHHYRQTGQVTPLVGVPLVQDVVDAWMDEGQTTYLAVLSSLIVLDTIQARGITNPLFGADDAVTLSGGRAAGISGLTSPRNSVVASLRTGLIGRSYRGRFYMPPPNEDDIEASILTGAYQNDLLAYILAAVEVISVASGNTYAMTIFSPTLSALGPIIDNLITSWLVRRQIGSQRRRRPVG